MATSLSGCAHGFPEQHPAAINVSKHVCLHYHEINRDPIKFDFEKDSKGQAVWRPLETCDGYIGLPPEDVAADETWYNENYNKKK